MKSKTLTLLILTAIVMASVACGPPQPAEVIVGTATPPPASATPPPASATPPPASEIPSAEDIREQQETAQMLSQQALAHVNSGNNAKAIQLYSQAIELWPSLWMHLNRGVAYGRSGNVAQACKDFHSAELGVASLDAESLEINADGLKILERNLSDFGC